MLLRDSPKGLIAYNTNKKHQREMKKVAEYLSDMVKASVILFGGFCLVALLCYAEAILIPFFILIATIKIIME